MEYYNRSLEISEAIHAGEQALETADRILDELDSARGWGIFDLIGGGLLSGLIKHDHMDKASNLVPRLRSELRTFRREMQDVYIPDGVNTDVGTFWSIADILCDDVLSDAVVLSRISNARRQMEDLREEILCALERLEGMR